MSEKLIAVEGLKLKMTPAVLHNISIKPAQKLALIDNKAIYTEALEFDVTNISFAADGLAVPGSVMGAKIMATATLADVEGKKPLRVGDKVTLTANDAQRFGASGAPEPSPITFTVEIIDAGQTLLYCA